MAVKKEQEELQALLAKKDYKKAIPLLREWMGKQPKNASVRLNLADALLASGQQDDAIQQYRDLATLLTEQGFIVKAIAVYKKILKLKPNFPEVEKMLSELSEKREKAEPPRKPQKGESTKDVSPYLEIDTKLFQGFNREEFVDLVSKLSLRHFEEDTIVVKEGDPGDSMFIVVVGEVRVLTRDSHNAEVVLGNLREGDFFGEIALLTGKPRTATIITNTDTELLELTRADYENIVTRYPRVKEVMTEFHEQRAYKTIEAMIQKMQH